MIEAFLKQNLRQGKMSSGGRKSAAETSAHLSGLFKKTSDNLGSRVKAANACEDFVQFLSPQELKELAEYQEELLMCSMT